MSAQRAPVAWSGPPDGDKAMHYPARSPRPGKDVLGVILSECITGVIVWFEPAQGLDHKGRSQPCTGDPKTCDGCISKRVHVWKGYLACWDYKDGRLFLAEVTKEAYLTCPGFEVFKRRLRGRGIHLKRNGKANNSRVSCLLPEYTGQHGELPAAFNVKSALERIWFGGDGPTPAGDKGPPSGPESSGRKGEGVSRGD